MSKTIVFNINSVGNQTDMDTFTTSLNNELALLSGYDLTNEPSIYLKTYSALTNDTDVIQEFLTKVNSSYVSGVNLIVEVLWEINSAIFDF